MSRSGAQDLVPSVLPPRHIVTRARLDAYYALQASVPLTSLPVAQRRLESCLTLTSDSCLPRTATGLGMAAPRIRLDRGWMSLW